jgi:hypothetical protein
MDPNTRLTLRTLRNRHIEEIIGIYRSCGLKWNMEIPTVEEVRTELSDGLEYETRPTGADISKMIFAQGEFQEKQYVHVYITYNRFAAAPPNADKLFDQRMREHFIT